MTKNRRIITVIIVLALVLLALPFNTASAEDNMSDTQIEKIRNNCMSIKNTLNQLHSSDALLRVNRGQIYESILTKLMTRFDGRLASNNLNNSALTSVTTSYTMSLDGFRSDYKNYEEQLALAISIDCTKQPVSFYDAVASARIKRNILHADVVRLNQGVDQYQTAVGQFKKDYQTAAEGITK